MSRTDIEVRPLGEIVDILDSQRVPVNRTERESRPGTVPYYGATGQVGYIDKALFNEELVLLGEDGAPFLDPTKPKAYLIDGPSWVNNHAHVLRAKEDVCSSRYLMHYLNYFRYEAFVSGTTRLKLNQGAMRKIPVLLLPLAQQQMTVQEIEKQFTRLDAAERLLNEVELQLRAYRASLLEENVRAGTRLAPSTDRQVPLDQVWDYAGYGTSVKCSYDYDGIPVLRIPNIREGRLDLTDLKRAQQSDDVTKLTLRENDLLIIRTNGSKNLIGRAAPVTSKVEMAFASYLIRLSLNPNLTTASYVASLLEAPSYRARMQQLAGSSSGQYNVSLSKLKKITIPVPSLAAQHELVRCLEAQSSMLLAVRAEIRTSRLQSGVLRRRILEKAFAGGFAAEGVAA